MNFTKIGFIGCGKMGSALAGCADKEGRTLYFSNRSPQKAEALAEKLGGIKTDNLTVAETCNLIVLAVKPQMMKEVLPALADTLAKRKDRFVILSIVAAYTIERIQELLGGDYPVIRTNPNTAVIVGKGITLVSDKNVTEDERKEFMEIFRSSGSFDEIDEHLMAAATVPAGCGPAFVYTFIDAMADGAVAIGVPREKAREYAAEVCKGAAELYLQSKEHPDKLKDDVCSPGGTTIQGIRALEKGGLRSAVIEAVIAAYEKTAELAKQ
ncbi:MAG: pyrroline-5-carboxylate reductase [Erysipelotrichales bacterium]|nr:pyrroline-5-carboxylate reductase [Erysipelotrichales bacterium]